MTRYAAMFDRLAAANEIAFGGFLMLGHPTPERTADQLDALVEGGCDMVEVGIPFSDPVADGPVIAKAAKQALEAGVRIAPLLASGVLPMQGPPGTGKTHTGAHMICELVRQGKKVGIVANGHEVIRNLLNKVIEVADSVDWVTQDMVITILHDKHVTSLSPPKIARFVSPQPGHGTRGTRRIAGRHGASACASLIVSAISSHQSPTHSKAHRPGSHVSR